MSGFLTAFEGLSRVKGYNCTIGLVFFWLVFTMGSLNGSRHEKLLADKTVLMEQKKIRQSPVGEPNSGYSYRPRTQGYSCDI